MRAIILICGALLFVAAAVYVANGLKPPESIRLATGIKDGGYWRIGLQYRAELARDGIRVELVETDGSLENIRRLAAGDVDAAFVQGGIDAPEDAALQSLGALFLEPISIFRGAQTPLDANPGEWRDIRLAAGPLGSGTRAAALSLIDAADVADRNIELIPAGGDAALEAVRGGGADAMLIVSPLEAPYLMEAIKAPDLRFVEMTLVEAMALRLPGASAATIPAGAITLDPPRPPKDMAVLALRASMLTRDDLHPAVVDRLVTAATALHGEQDILHEFREYPSVESPPAPINRSAWQHIVNGPSFLHDIFPYWIAAQFGRVLFIVLPLLFIAPSLLTALPTGYAWFQNRRVWSNYQRIAVIEADLAQADTRDEIEAVAADLEELDAKLAGLAVPLAYRQSAYNARLHIELIRKEIQRRLSEKDGAGSNAPR